MAEVGDRFAGEEVVGLVPLVVAEVDLEARPLQHRAHYRRVAEIQPVAPESVVDCAMVRREDIEPLRRDRPAHISASHVASGVAAPARFLGVLAGA